MNCIAIGQNAGQISQKDNAVAIGINAGNASQGPNTVAIGSSAGTNTQGQLAIAIGNQSGLTLQGQYGIAIGVQSGSGTQGQQCVAIGNSAGFQSQGSGAIAIGFGAGSVGTTGQGINAIAIGVNAGNTQQGVNAIAIGQFAGQTSQGANSIVINASGTAFTTTTPSACFIRPLRALAASTALYYNSTTFELSYLTSSSTTKNTIQDLTVDTSIITQLKPKTYHYNTDPDAGIQVGYIAEDVKVLNKHFATYDIPEGNPVAINYNTIVVFLVEEVKKLKQELAILKDQLTPNTATVPNTILYNSAATTLLNP